MNVPQFAPCTNIRLTVVADAGVHVSVNGAETSPELIYCVSSFLSINFARLVDADEPESDKYAELDIRFFVRNFGECNVIKPPPPVVWLNQQLLYPEFVYPA